MKNIKINFVDRDYDGSESKLITVEEIPDELNMDDVYNIFDTLWNGGDSYETYEEYCEEWDENEIIKNNFDKLVEATLSNGWCIESFCEVINVLYPEVKASVVKEDYELTFYW